MTGKNYYVKIQNLYDNFKKHNRTGPFWGAKLLSYNYRIIVHLAILDWLFGLLGAVHKIDNAFGVGG